MINSALEGKWRVSTSNQHLWEGACFPGILPHWPLPPQHTHSEIAPSDSWVRHCSHPGLPGCKHGNSLALALSVRGSEDPRHLISSNQASGSSGRLGVVEDALGKGEGGKAGQRDSQGNLLTPPCLENPNSTLRWWSSLLGC